MQLTDSEKIRNKKLHKCFNFNPLLLLIQACKQGRKKSQKVQFQISLISSFFLSFRSLIFINPYILASSRICHIFTYNGSTAFHVLLLILELQLRSLILLLEALGNTELVSHNIGAQTSSLQEAPVTILYIPVTSNDSLVGTYNWCHIIVVY